ncbi:Maintenance of ploidy protein mob2 [Malassezia restricta CBS 7877]|uniref:Maintenance of ploidy protein mob2 n=1 Tax=Malassezia restricta (strain ATCC 96810 / NBRC 103918 / CBS 7877) TaxID=425264 RepID=A0A3G2S8M6_MALR7|nr:Maintenance of ploidy protein mob2 [Malassezia restricta CBS 7877]
MSFFNQIGRSMGLPSRSAKPRAQPQPQPVVLERPWGDAPVPAPHKPLYLCQPFERSTLIKGSFRTIVALPKYVHPYEWVAINLCDFFHNLNLFCGVLTEFMTTQAQPTMSAGVGMHYTWVDIHRKPIHLPAAQYIDFVMTWIAQLLQDEAVFPTRPGRDFPPTFPTTAKHMYKHMLRIFAHIYHAHFPELVHLSCEGHLNSLFAHFLVFGHEFQLFQFAEFKGGPPAPTPAYVI